MKLGIWPYIGAGVAALLTIAMLLNAGWTRPPIHSVETGYRGTAMDWVGSPTNAQLVAFSKTLPDPIDKASPDGDRAVDTYKNVKVLTDLSTEQFNRVMLAITQWVAPEQGCAYCHNVENLADDGLYTKVVARKMLQMTRYINTNWKQHVANTGVTCYTCHGGNPVPSNIWFNNPPPEGPGGFAATNYGFGHPTKVAGYSEMSSDPFSPYLENVKDSESIRVLSVNALPGPYGASIQKTEQSYSLMLHMSNSLGVNCTYCHNSRAFSSWEQSTPQRVTAWYGIRMARTLNTEYLDSLKGVFPPARLGPHGDNAKLNCATCHQGVFKPLYGISMAKDYPELDGVPAK